MVKKILFLIVVLISNIIQCITGFAGTVLAMPFSIMLVGYDYAKPILNILGILASVFIVAKDYKYVDVKEFIKIISIMLVGIVGGIYAKNLIGIDGKVFYVILGVVVIIFSVYNAYRFYAKKETKLLPLYASIPLLVICGIIHGMFVCGGPLLVTYYSAVAKSTKEFRSTLSAVWIILNSIILFDDVKAGFFNIQLLQLLLLCVGVLVVAMFVGNKLYNKMNRSTFLKISYLLMLISGISLILK